MLIRGSRQPEAVMTATLSPCVPPPKYRFSPLRFSHVLCSHSLRIIPGWAHWASLYLMLSCPDYFSTKIRGLCRYSPMSEVCAPRYLAGLMSTHG